ncbi:tetratricopeptide repeat protein [Actinospica durhamensis]|uniref:Tetratricopeptide repeat protein n=1 Tax=Actinospica durhamensis TaxID=1508375 RepID=A0A941EXH8_9ACTN|nr:BTAD domain-containing putative transcriptional regulator [Actinospica durhamensis]MBR7836814.1 tetratricopeptide repeat protein [Actinospica durhamensis]
MRFNLLGPVTVDVDGDEIVLPAGIPRAVLVVLLLSANRVVSAEQLAEALWGEQRPAAAGAGLRNHVVRLRRQLGAQAAARLHTVAPGYRIEISPGELDEDVFLEGCRAGREQVGTGDFTAAHQSLTAALRLWRGDPLADAPPHLEVAARIHQLQEARLAAWQDRIEADLHLGRDQELVSELRGLIQVHPLREALHGQLMLALYRAGRQAEALDAYQDLRRLLVDELGVEPSAPLELLNRRILSADAELEAPVRDVEPTRSADASSGFAHGTVAQPVRTLPPDTRVFTGRTRECEALLALARDASQCPGTVVISAIDGMAGIGKSALAIHAAHRMSADFPDGQLFIDLHGHTAGLEPMTAGEALDRLLRALRVSPQLIPKGLEGRAELYRDRLAGTKTLIVLDNAFATAQVRPLLPGTPGCLVVVTSRRRLTGLDDAHSLAVDVLSETEAITLLRAVAGPGRLPDDDPALAELVGLCGNLPLAVRIIAAQLRHHRALSVADLVRRLREEPGGLDRFRDEDRDLAAVFDLSYTALPAAAQCMFRFLGQVPGSDFDGHTAAALAGVEPRTAERLLESLLDHNLLIQHLPGRYRFHDLIRVYARELMADARAEEREVVLDRLWDYYQHAAQAAGSHFIRQTRPGAAPVPVTPTATPILSDRNSALEWMRAEQANLLAVAAFVSAHAHPARVVALAAALAATLRQQGFQRETAVLHETAVAAAHGLGDGAGEAGALWELGQVHDLAGEYEKVAGCHERALALYRSLGNRLGMANAFHALGKVRSMTSDYPTAAGLLQQALTVFQGLGSRRDEADTLLEMAWVSCNAGDFTAADSLAKRALALFEELGDRFGQGDALRLLGLLHSHTGGDSDGIELSRQALAIFVELGERRREALVLGALGQLHAEAGDHAAAIEMLQRALVAFRDMGGRVGLAGSLYTLGRVYRATGDFVEAADLLERARVIYQSVGSPHLESNVLKELGEVWHAVGDHAAATDLLNRALTLYRVVGDLQGESEGLLALGALTADTAGPREAIAVYRRSVDAAVEHGSPIDQARAHEGIARCAARTGDLETALADLRQAVDIYQSCGAVEADAAMAFLAALEDELRLGGVRQPPAGAVG